MGGDAEDCLGNSVAVSTDQHISGAPSGYQCLEVRQRTRLTVLPLCCQRYKNWPLCGKKVTSWS